MDKISSAPVQTRASTSDIQALCIASHNLWAAEWLSRLVEETLIGWACVQISA
ncbi:hypothetical protein Plhal304r1_c016g0057781 [Plasmopara halstedii]